MALTISIGFVVDDAIGVVENIDMSRKAYRRSPSHETRAATTSSRTSV
jgi:multidrug efflux pump subunit AcrB